MHLRVLGSVFLRSVDDGGCGDALGEGEGPGHGLCPLAPRPLSPPLFSLHGVEPLGLEVGFAMKRLRCDGLDTL